MSAAIDRAAEARFRAFVETSLEGEPAMLTGDRVAELCGVSRRTVQTWTSSGELLTARLGSSRGVRIPRSALAAFLVTRRSR